MSSPCDYNAKPLLEMLEKPDVEAVAIQLGYDPKVKVPNWTLQERIDDLMELFQEDGYATEAQALVNAVAIAGAYRAVDLAHSMRAARDKLHRMKSEYKELIHD